MMEVLQLVCVMGFFSIQVVAVSECAMLRQAAMQHTACLGLFYCQGREAKASQPGTTTHPTRQPHTHTRTSDSQPHTHRSRARIADNEGTFEHERRAQH